MYAERIALRGDSIRVHVRAILNDRTEVIYDKE